MRIIIQIPCFNEEETIAEVISDIRSATEKYDDYLILIVDDGSEDNTVEVAQKAGADYVAQHARNQGLAHAYMTGLAASLNLGADIILNTDADNQYQATNIPKLLTPVAAGSADVVVGARSIETIKHFSPFKRLMQRFGSAVVRGFSGTDVKDATSGFRAVSREAALRFNSFSDYTYTLETLIQAGRSGMVVRSVDITINPPTRPSRLMRNLRHYLFRSVWDILRISAIYSPMKGYFLAGALPMLVTVVLGFRYLVLVLEDPTRSHAPSLILAAVLACLSFVLWALGIIGELMAINRRILEELRVNQRRRDAAEGRVHARADFKIHSTINSSES
jgi:glycosyltransferase involved in cell wall biosynthesis